MADGKVTYEFEADYSGLENDVKKAEKIVSDSSDEVAKKQKENDKEVAESARQATDEKVKAVTEGNKEIAKSSDEIKNKLSALNKEYDDNKQHIQSVKEAVNELTKEKNSLVMTLENVPSSFPNYNKYEQDLEKVNKKLEEARFALAEFNTEQTTLKLKIKDTERELTGQAKGLQNVADSANKTKTSTRGVTTDLTAFIRAIQTGNLSVQTFSRALLGIAGPIGIFAAALGGVITLVKKFNDEKEESRKRLDAAAQSLAQSSEASRREYDELSKLVREYERLGSQTNITSDEKNSLAEIQNKLNSSFLTEEQRINNSTKSYREQLILLREISELKFDEAMRAAEDSHLVASGAYYDIPNMRLELAKVNWNFRRDISKASEQAILDLSNEFENLKANLLDDAGVSVTVTGNAKEQLDALMAVRRALIQNGDSYSKLFATIDTAITAAEKTTKNYVDETRNLADMQRIASGEIEDATNSIEEQTDTIEKNTDVLEDNQKAAQNLESSARRLSNAFAEVNENGSLTVETTLALIDAGYAAALAIDNETGAVRINAAAYRDLAQAKLEAQQADYAAQMIELRGQRNSMSSRVNHHNMSVTVPQIQEIDNQIKILELQNAAVGNISNNIDSVISGTYGRSSSSSSPRQSVTRAPTERLQRPESSGGNIISITSYVPTIWDDVATANAKLERGLGASIVGNSSTGKLVTGLETLSDNVGNISVPTAKISTTKEATLRDVVSAINDLKDSPTPKQPLNINLTARDLTIGRVAVADINEMTERDGKSPLNR